jgi:hypothetical protein
MPNAELIELTTPLHVPGPAFLLVKHTHAGGDKVVSLPDIVAIFLPYRHLHSLAEAYEVADAVLTLVFLGEQDEIGIDKFIEVDMKDWTRHPSRLARRDTRSKGLRLPCGLCI